MLTFFFLHHLNPRTDLLQHNCFKYDCNASLQNTSFFRTNHTWFFPPRQIALFVLLLFTAFLNVKNLELRASISVTAFKLLWSAAEVTKKKKKYINLTLMLPELHSAACKRATWHWRNPRLYWCTAVGRQKHRRILQHPEGDRRIPVPSTTELLAKELPLSFYQGLGLQYQLYSVRMT